MRQIIINIPENKYVAFINHIKRKFSDIQIKEKKTTGEEKISDVYSIEETLLLSEESLAEDWLSDADNKWDEVL